MTNTAGMTTMEAGGSVERAGRYFLTLDVAALPAGVYLVHVRMQDHDGTVVVDAVRPVVVRWQ